MEPLGFSNRSAATRGLNGDVCSCLAFTSWMLTKMTARLQAANALAGGPNPILLRVDFDAGHGIGSGRAQALKLRADEYTFLGWRLGMSGFEASP